MRCLTSPMSITATSIPGAIRCHFCYIHLFRCTRREVVRRSAPSVSGPRPPAVMPWRKRSTDDVAREMAKAKEYWPWVKEFFFDDDTFNIQKARTVELCAKLKPLRPYLVVHFARHHRLRNAESDEGSGLPLLIVGYESGDQQILKNIKKGATLERARQFTKDCHKLGLVIHGDFIMGLPGETHETINNTIAFAKELDVETIQVSVAHAYPGTELYDYAMKNGFMVADSKMVDEGGHQMAQIQYPGLPADEIMGAVHRFYDEYYFRPKAVYRILRKAVFNGVERKRLYKEARSFLKLRASRNKWVKEKRAKGRVGNSGGAGKGLRLACRLLLTVPASD